MGKIKRFIQDKKGFYTLEVILATPLILFTLLMGIALFTYVYPIIMVRVTTHELCQAVKVNGGLPGHPANNLTIWGKYQEKLSALYSDVTISTEPVSAQGVTPVTYIKRGDGTVIVLKVTYRKNKWIVSLIDFFGVSADTTSDFQTVSESTTSERW